MVVMGMAVGMFVVVGVVVMVLMVMSVVMVMKMDVVMSMVVAMHMVVGMVRIVDVVGMLLFPVDQHVHVVAGDAAGLRLMGRYGNAGQQMVHGLQKCLLLLRGQKLKEGDRKSVV